MIGEFLNIVSTSKLRQVYSYSRDETDSGQIVLFNDLIGKCIHKLRNKSAVSSVFQIYHASTIIPILQPQPENHRKPSASCQKAYSYLFCH